MPETLLPDLAAWIICAVTVFFGTLIQRMSGAGYCMFAAPVMAIAAPEWVPGMVLLVGIVIGSGAMLNTRGSVQRKDLPPGFAGRILGAGIAPYIATAVVGTGALAIVGALFCSRLGSRYWGFRLQSPPAPCLSRVPWVVSRER